MKRFMLILIACCCLASGAYADGQTEADSLYRVAQTLPHDSTRLEMLKKLAQIEQLTPKCITYSNLLREEATLQNNDKYNWRLSAKIQSHCATIWSLMPGSRKPGICISTLSASRQTSTLMKSSMNLPSTRQTRCSKGQRKWTVSAD